MTLCFGKYKLRPFRRGDEPSIAANINDKKIERYTLAIPYPYGLKCARQWVKFNWVWLLFSDTESVAFSNTNSLNV